MKKLTHLIEATRNEHLKESSNDKLLDELKEKGVITNVVYRNDVKFIDCGGDLFHKNNM